MARMISTTSAGVPVGPQMTLDALMARQRDLTRELPSANRDMQSPWQGAAYLGEVLANKINQGRIDRQLAEGRAGLANAMAGVDMSGNSIDPSQIAQVSQYDPDMGIKLWEMSAGMMQAARQREQALADRVYAAGNEARINEREKQEEIAREDRNRVSYGQPITGKAAGDLGLDPSRSYQLNERTGQYDPVGGGAGVTINTGDSSSALTKKFDEEEGKAWQAYQAAGVKAAGLRNDMMLLDELGKVAPQGPVPGRIAQIFPGFNSAGAAYDAIVKRLAPQMRVEGSGATSDIEYAGMVNSLPKLSNYPEANQLIGAMVKAKAEMDIRRADIVTAWRNQTIDAATARTQLNDLNRQSIMSPELARLIAATETEQGGAAPATGGGASGGWSVEEVP